MRVFFVKKIARNRKKLTTNKGVPKLLQMKNFLLAGKSFFHENPFKTMLSVNFVSANIAHVMGLAMKKLPIKRKS